MPLPRQLGAALRRLRLRPLDRLRRPANRLFDAERPHRRAGGEALAFLQSGLQTKFHRVDAQRARDHIRLRIVGPDHLRHAEAAKRARRNFVGVDAVGIDPDVGNAVRSGRGVARLVADARADFGVGAGVPVDFALARHDRAVLNRGFDLRDHFVLGDRQKLFFAGERITHRLLGEQRQHRHQRLQFGIKLGAVAAAEIRHAHANRFMRNAEGRGNFRPHIRRRLAGGPDVSRSCSSR